MPTWSTTDADGRRAYTPPMGRAWLLPLYDPFSRLVGAHKVHRRLLDEAALRPGDRVLEIGCGTGNLLLLAQRLSPGIVATGLDPDAAALARAARKARRRGVDLRLDLGYADALPYPDESVDVVLSSLMLHHLPEEVTVPALREARRVLRPGGRLHVLDFGSDSHGHGLRFRGPHARPAESLPHAQTIPAHLRAAGLEVGRVTPVRTRTGAFVLVDGSR